MEKIIMKKEYQAYIERLQEEFITAECKREIEKEDVKHILINKIMESKCVNVNGNYDTDYQVEEFKEYLLSRNDEELLKNTYLFGTGHDTERQIIYYEQISFCK